LHKLAEMPRIPNGTSRPSCYGATRDLAGHHRAQRAACDQCFARAYTPSPLAGQQLPAAPTGGSIAPGHNGLGQLSPRAKQSLIRQRVVSLGETRRPSDHPMITISRPGSAARCADGTANLLDVLLGRAPERGDRGCSWPAAVHRFSCSMT
jgi:hypothetical protein